MQITVITKVEVRNSNVAKVTNDVFADEEDAVMDVERICREAGRSWQEVKYTGAKKAYRVDYGVGEYDIWTIN